MRDASATERSREALRALGATLVGPCPPSSARRRGGAALVGAAVVCLLLLNFFCPVAKGPPDNGDFKRIFASFSSGPDDVAFWPEDTGGPEFQRRFWYFHRFWRLDGGVASEARPSTSNLLFMPARLARFGQPDDFYDLTANAAYVTAGLGCVLAISLARLRAPAAFVSLSAIALVLSDANVCGYLGSFYQEAGAFVYLLLYVCALWTFWQRRTLTSLALAIGACVLLSGTKLAYAPTACVVIAPALVGIATADWPSSRKRRAAALSTVTIAAALAGGSWVLSDRLISQSAAYIFTFTTALPSLPEEARAPYLALLDVDPGYVSEAGMNPFDPGARSFFDPSLGERLGTPLLRRAITRLVLDHPWVALRLLRDGGTHFGVYPPLMFASEGVQRPGPIAAPWSGWSAIHASVLNGWPLCALVAVLCTVLGTRLRRNPRDGWRLLFWTVATSFLVGALLQALISTFGNGLVDIERHLFLANMLLDVALISATAGLLCRSTPAPATPC